MFLLLRVTEEEAVGLHAYKSLCTIETAVYCKVQPAILRGRTLTLFFTFGTFEEPLSSDLSMYIHVLCSPRGLADGLRLVFRHVCAMVTGLLPIGTEQQDLV